MRYKEIEQGFMDAINNYDSPYKFSKQQQIKRWTVLYWSLLENGGEKGLKFISQALSSEDSWDIKKDTRKNIISVNLNRRKVATKLLEPEIPDGTKSPLNNDDRYHIACWNCFSDKIKEIFEEFKKEYSLDSSEESIKKLIRIKSKRPLTTFWSHFINRDVLSDEDKDKYSYEYGLERAKAEGCIEAIEFFWGKKPISLSLEEKCKKSIDIALHNTINRSATFDMVYFCLDYFSDFASKEEFHKQLLEEDFDRNSYYLTFNTLMNNFSFDLCKRLFSYLIPQKDSGQSVKPGELSLDHYNISMFAILDRVNSISDESSIKQANELIDFMYNKKGFEGHKQSFIDEVGDYTSPARHTIIEIINDNKDVEIVKKILLDIPADKIKTISKYDEWAANYLLENELFSLEHLKQLMTTIDESSAAIDKPINEEFRIKLPDIIKSMENK